MFFLFLSISQKKKKKKDKVKDTTFAGVCIRQACGTLPYSNFKNNLINVQP